MQRRRRARKQQVAPNAAWNQQSVASRFLERLIDKRQSAPSTFHHAKVLDFRHGQRSYVSEIPDSPDP